MLDLLRNNEATKDIKVIMMTALSGDQHRERGEGLGANRYLVKSQVGIEDVVSTVHEILGDRNNTAEAGAAIQAVSATAVPATPAPNQSPVNPSAATAPNVTAGVPATTLPATPLNVPTVTTPNVPAAPQPPAVSAPQVSPTPVATPTIASVPDTPTVPTSPPTDTPDLPPVAPPSDAPPAESTLPPPASETITSASNAPAPAPAVNNVPSFQPKDATNNDGGEQDAAYKPAVDLAQSGTHIGTSVIHPTGESLTPQVDVQNLIANEEARDIVAQPAPSQTPPTAATTEIQVNPSGAINTDSLPAAPSQDSSTFPNQA
jgi:hypothetical protein